MAFQTLEDKEQIVLLLKRLLHERKEVNLRIQGEKTGFTSKILKINQDDLSSSISKRSSLIIEKLKPEKGNNLIQSTSEVSLEFAIDDKSCRCLMDYIGISSTPPNFGFIVSIPDNVEIEERRQEERVTFEVPDFVSAEFKLGKGGKEEEKYEMDVMNCSSRGLGLLITKENFGLLEKLKVGDRIKDMYFFATWAMVKVNGLIKHITRIEDGANKGCYQLGIESRDIIDSCKAKNS